MSASSSELVSVVIPTYNCASTISRALDSVLAQDYSPLEIIVVDDGSKDRTREVVRHYADVKYLVHPSNRGVSAARNTGITNAGGKFIAFLDADDEWFPDKISKQVRLMKSSPLKPGLVTCNSCVIGQGRKYTSTENIHRIVPAHRGRDLGGMLLKQNFMPTTTVMVRADVLENVGLFNEKLKTTEDLELWVRISFQYSIDYLSDVLARFHDRPGSLMESYDYRSPHVVNVIENLCNIFSEKISNREKREIVGSRYVRLANYCWQKRDYDSGLVFISRALSSGYISKKILVVVVKCLLGKARLYPGTSP